MEYIMYAFLAMVLLMLLWALRLWYRMHQEETVYAVYKKSDYIFCLCLSSVTWHFKSVR